MSSTKPPMIEITKLCLKRGERVLFDNISLTIPRGKIVAVMGPSGTGKTTLLRLIGGQVYPDSGQILVNGENISQLNKSALYKARRKMGMLFQSSALFTHLSVFENVAFPLREHTRLPEPMIRDLVLIKLQAVGLRGARAMMPGELSGGMARRVALARALALDPELMMYDEPFAGQDPITLGILAQLIRRLNEALGITSVIVSHDVAETASIADYIYVIADGKILAAGIPESLLQDKTPRVHQFINGLPDGPVPFHYPACDYHEDLAL